MTRDAMDRWYFAHIGALPQPSPAVSGPVVAEQTVGGPPVERTCPRCGKATIQTWPSDLFGFAAGCKPCYEDDVEAWAIAGAVPVRFGRTAIAALTAWDSRPLNPAKEPA